MRDEALDVWVQTERAKADELAGLRRDNAELRRTLADLWSWTAGELDESTPLGLRVREAMAQKSASAP